MTIVLTVIAVLLFFPLIVGYFISAPKYSGPLSDHFDGKQFINPGGLKAKGFKDILPWIFNRKREPWTEKLTADFGEKPPANVSDGIRITFVNHSTFLIQVNGVNIITDPVWSKYTSPFQFAGPKRMRPPGIRFEDLPKIDFILLSHNHYDHLDIITVKRLHEKFKPKIITPLGVKAFLDNHSITSATDLDWWDEISLTDSLKVQAVPAQHFSGRGTFDRDATLWCGYVIKRKEGNIHFVGDTGYNELTFKEIGERCAPINISLVPIGAYRPQWFMSIIHCSPEEALKIHKDLKSKQSIATHFGTFALADDGETEPVNELAKAKRELSLPENEFLVLKEGEGRDFQ